MKQLFLAAVLLGAVLYGKSQQSYSASDTIQVVLDNKQVKVTEYISTKGKGACGKGKHSHPPHLSIFLTDAIVRLTTVDGKTQDFDVKAGASFWSEAETHVAINNGSKPARVYLIELK